jgi:hypothetical protein
MANEEALSKVKTAQGGHMILARLLPASHGFSNKKSEEYLSPARLFCPT